MRLWRHSQYVCSSAGVDVWSLEWKSPHLQRRQKLYYQYILAAPDMGSGAKFPKMSLSPTVKHTGHKTGGELYWNVQILIVSVVNICKQCLQTDSRGTGHSDPLSRDWLYDAHALDACAFSFGRDSRCVLVCSVWFVAYLRDGGAFFFVFITFSL